MQPAQAVNPADLKPLEDAVRLPVRALLVGINPGIRSSLTGHHFAGYSNRFWRLLYESGLVSEPLRAEDDRRLPDWGFGITNIVARPTPGIDTLRPDEYIAGVRVLARKVRRWRPRVVVFVGITAYRAAAGRSGPRKIATGLQALPFAGIPAFVLPNPSGRNANYSYAEMLNAFKDLAKYLGTAWE